MNLCQLFANFGNFCQLFANFYKLFATSVVLTYLHWDWSGVFGNGCIFFYPLIKSGANVQFLNFFRYVPICLLFSGLESILYRNLWWVYDGFDELLFRFFDELVSCYCINSFLFSYQIVRMFYQINAESFYLHQIQHMNTGTKCQHMRQLAVLQSLFGKPEKLVVRGFRLPLVPRESPRHGEPFVVFWWSVSYADYFLMFGFTWFFNLSSVTQPILADVVFSPILCSFFDFFQSGWSVLWPSKISQALKLISHGVHFNKTNAWPEQLVFWFLMFFPHLNLDCLQHSERVECGV